MEYLGRDGVQRGGDPSCRAASTHEQETAMPVLASVASVWVPRSSRCTARWMDATAPRIQQLCCASLSEGRLPLAFQPLFSARRFERAELGQWLKKAARIESATVWRLASLNRRRSPRSSKA